MLDPYGNPRLDTAKESKRESNDDFSKSIMDLSLTKSFAEMAAKELPNCDLDYCFRNKQFISSTTRDLFKVWKLAQNK